MSLSSFDDAARDAGTLAVTNNKVTRAPGSAVHLFDGAVNKQPPSSKLVFDETFDASPRVFAPTVPYTPTTELSTDGQQGAATTEITYSAISKMKAYTDWSFEELRIQALLSVSDHGNKTTDVSTPGSNIGNNNAMKSTATGKFPMTVTKSNGEKSQLGRSPTHQKAEGKPPIRASRFGLLSEDDESDVDDPFAAPFKSSRPPLSKAVISDSDADTDPDITFNPAGKEQQQQQQPSSRRGRASGPVVIVPETESDTEDDDATPTNTAAAITTINAASVTGAGDTTPDLLECVETIVGWALEKEDFTPEKTSHMIELVRRIRGDAFMVASVPMERYEEVSAAIAPILLGYTIAERIALIDRSSSCLADVIKLVQEHIERLVASRSTLLPPNFLPIPFGGRLSILPEVTLLQIQQQIDAFQTAEMDEFIAAVEHPELDDDAQEQQQRHVECTDQPALRTRNDAVQTVRSQQGESKLEMERQLEATTAPTGRAVLRGGRRNQKFSEARSGGSRSGRGSGSGSGSAIKWEEDVGAPTAQSSAPTTQSASLPPHGIEGLGENDEGRFAKMHAYMYTLLMVIGEDGWAQSTELEVESLWHRLHTALQPQQQQQQQQPTCMAGDVRKLLRDFTSTSSLAQRCLLHHGVYAKGGRAECARLRVHAII
jgi:hypothetical protein